MSTGISGLFKNTKGAREANLFWNDIPVGRQNALTYNELCALWHCDTRQARKILHDLSVYDNGDDYILIRSSKCKGFYKTDDEAEIRAYKRECLNKGRSIFAPVKKINRVLAADCMQYGLFNNLRAVREGKGITRREVCRRMKHYVKGFDKSLLAKIENGVCLPTYYQLSKLAEILDCMPSELLVADLYY